MQVTAEPIDATVLPSGTGCAECEENDGWWFHMRRCAQCGHIGCCDSSPSQHASAHAAATGHPGIGTIHAPDTQAALKNLERMACESGDVPANVVRGMLTSSAVPLLVAHIGRYGGKRVVGQIEEVTVMGAGGQTGDKYTTNPLFIYSSQTQQVQKAYPVQGEWGRGRF